MTNPVPGPPIQPGPGVVPPFAAPPREGNRRRMWTGLGIGAAVFVLCCGGGIFGLGALVVSSTSARSDEARTVVEKYMTAWQGQDYPGAYQLVCDEVRDTTSLASFTGDLSQVEVSEFDVGTPRLNTDTTVVPVRITFSDGDTEDDSFGVVLDSNQDSKVCQGVLQ